MVEKTDPPLRLLPLYVPVAAFAVFGGAISYALLRAVGVDVDGGAGWWQPVPFVLWAGGTYGLCVLANRLERVLRRLIRA